MIQKAIQKAVLSLLWFDRKIIKAYTGIETPLYRLWWNDHKHFIQRQLNAEHLCNDTF